MTNICYHMTNIFCHMTNICCHMILLPGVVCFSVWWQPAAWGQHCSGHHPGTSSGRASTAQPVCCCLSLPLQYFPGDQICRWREEGYVEVVVIFVLFVGWGVTLPSLFLFFPPSSLPQCSSLIPLSHLPLSSLFPPSLLPLPSLSPPFHCLTPPVQVLASP